MVKHTQTIRRLYRDLRHEGVSKHWLGLLIKYWKIFMIAFALRKIYKSFVLIVLEFLVQ